MPAKDLFHEVVKTALVKDGWTITDDPYKLQWGDETLYVDLAAERVIAAGKENRRIAVEVKSFVEHSERRIYRKLSGNTFCIAY